MPYDEKTGTFTVSGDVVEVTRQTLNDALKMLKDVTRDHVKRLVIPTSVKTIGPSGFEKLANLEQVDFAPAPRVQVGCGVTVHKRNTPKRARELRELCPNFDLAGRTGTATAVGLLNVTVRFLIEPQRPMQPAKKRAPPRRNETQSFVLPAKMLKADDTRITAIHDFAFKGCVRLQHFKVPASVSLIGDEVFAECSNLASVTFESDATLTSIGNRVFEDCHSMAGIDLPSSLKDLRLLGTSLFFCVSHEPHGQRFAHSADLDLEDPHGAWRKASEKEPICGIAAAKVFGTCKCVTRCTYRDAVPVSVAYDVPLSKPFEVGDRVDVYVEGGGRVARTGYNRRVSLGRAAGELRQGRIIRCIPVSDSQQKGSSPYVVEFEKCRGIPRTDGVVTEHQNLQLHLPKTAKVTLVFGTVGAAPVETILQRWGRPYLRVPRGIETIAAAMTYYNDYTAWPNGQTGFEQMVVDCATFASKEAQQVVAGRVPPGALIPQRHGRALTLAYLDAVTMQVKHCARTLKKAKADGRYYPTDDDVVFPGFNDIAYDTHAATHGPHKAQILQSLAFSRSAREEREKASRAEFEALSAMFPPAKIQLGRDVKVVADVRVTTPRGRSVSLRGRTGTVSTATDHAAAAAANPDVRVVFRIADPDGPFTVTCAIPEDMLGPA